MIRIALALAFPLVVATAATFHCDPVHGSAKGEGSAGRPWGRIEEVIRARLFEVRDAQGLAADSKAQIKAGDTVLLRSGWHGVIRLPGGYNEEPITIAAAPGHTAQVGWIDIAGGRNWVIKGLSVSPSLSPTPLARAPRDLVKLGEHGATDSTGLVIEDCFIYSVLDTSHWSAQDWITKPQNGIWLGRHGKRHIARNNFVLNTRFGISLCAPDCIAEGNVVANFSGDGMRVTRDGQVAQFNVIKNGLVSARDGDDNHDDGIQCFLFNAGRGTVRNVTLRGNVIINREKDGLPFPNGVQGIGFFDGPLVNFLVESNVVCVNHFHGLSLYDAQGCTIRDNTCFTRSTGRMQPWVMLGQKRKSASGNTVERNYAHSFNFKADAQVKADGNQTVTAAIFDERLQAAMALIEAKFGKTHPAAKRMRLELEP